MPRGTNYHYGRSLKCVQSMLNQNVRHTMPIFKQIANMIKHISCASLHWSCDNIRTDRNLRCVQEQRIFAEHLSPRMALRRSVGNMVYCAHMYTACLWRVCSKGNKVYICMSISVSLSSLSLSIYVWCGVWGYGQGRGILMDSYIYIYILYKHIWILVMYLFCIVVVEVEHRLATVADMKAYVNMFDCVSFWCVCVCVRVLFGGFIYTEWNSRISNTSSALNRFFLLDSYLWSFHYHAPNYINTPFIQRWQPNKDNLTITTWEESSCVFPYLSRKGNIVTDQNNWYICSTNPNIF